MSILWSSENEHFLDHRQLTRVTYRETTCQKRSNDKQFFAYRKDYFEVHSPYIPERIKNPEKRGRKRKIPMNEEELASEEYHSTVCHRLTKAVEKFFDEVPKLIMCGEIMKCTAPDTQCKSCSKSFQQLCLQMSHKNGHIYLSNESPIHLDLQDTVNKLVTYSGQHPRVLCISKEKYLLPRNCSFMRSDLAQIDALIEVSRTQGGYDIIVADPPWENKSVKRGKRYSWLSLDDIANIPLKQMMSKTCVIFVWVTNKQKIHKFVKEQLFPAHGIEFVTEWHWIKITRTGTPIFDFSSAHKRPYETILVGKAKNFELHIPPAILLSIPCTIHSHKPPLSMVIEKVLSLNLDNQKCLELFARNLMPGWTSWGNEVLELQNMKHFECEHTD